MTRRSFCPSELPCSAAIRNQYTACPSSLGMLRPSRYLAPSSACAEASPCAAALWTVSKSELRKFAPKSATGGVDWLCATATVCRPKSAAEANNLSKSFHGSITASIPVQWDTPEPRVSTSCLWSKTQRRTQFSPVPAEGRTSARYRLGALYRAIPYGKTRTYLKIA